MKKNKNLAVRAILLILLIVGFVTIVLPARNRVRVEHQSKQTLLTLQQALQKFHVEDEAYPKKTPMSGEELIQFLLESKHLGSPPINPITLLPYTFESGEEDHIVYTTDELAETYSLKITKADSDDILFIVDSTEHHSLE